MRRCVAEVALILLAINITCIGKKNNVALCCGKKRETNRSTDLDDKVLLDLYAEVFGDLLPSDGVLVYQLPLLEQEI